MEAENNYAWLPGMSCSLERDAAVLFLKAQQMYPGKDVGTFSLKREKSPVS